MCAGIREENKISLLLQFLSRKCNRIVFFKFLPLCNTLILIGEIAPRLWKTFLSGLPLRFSSKLNEEGTTHRRTRSILRQDRAAGFVLVFAHHWKMIAEGSDPGYRVRSADAFTIAARERLFIHSFVHRNSRAWIGPHTLRGGRRVNVRIMFAFGTATRNAPFLTENKI